jgi:hypothetical protein
MGKLIALLEIIVAGCIRLLQKTPNMTQQYKCGPQTLIFSQSQMLVGSHSYVQLLLISHRYLPSVYPVHDVCTY